MDHYHLCINLPPPALLISDSSLAPAAAGGGDRPMFQTALALNLWWREQTKDRLPRCSFTRSADGSLPHTQISAPRSFTEPPPAG